MTNNTVVLERQSLSDKQIEELQAEIIRLKARIYRLQCEISVFKAAGFTPPEQRQTRGEG